MSNTIQLSTHTHTESEISLLVNLLKLARAQHEVIRSVLPALSQLQSPLAEAAEQADRQAVILRIVEEALLARYANIQNPEIKQQVFDLFNH